jgi:hypothetical protein
MKAELTHLLLAVDLGGSGTKIVGGVQGREGEEKVSIVMPHCIEVKNTDELLFDLDFSEHNTWLKIGGVGYAVGNLAATKFNATNKLKPAKFTVAVPKICAAIAVFSQLFKLPVKFNLSLTFVLPPAEWEQKTIVIERLQVALKDLDTPKGKIKPKLISVSANPEGMGVLLGQNLNLKELANATTVMLGHRNASVFATKFGVMSRPQTSDLGFQTILKDIASKTGYGIDDLIQPLVNYKYNQDWLKFWKKRLLEEMVNKKDKTPDPYASREREINSNVTKYQENILTSELRLTNSFQCLLKCSGADLEIERTRLIDIIDKSMIEYVNKLTDWLGENMDSGLDRLCLCGGTSNFLLDEIKPFLLEQLIDKNEKRLLRHAPLSEDAKKISGLTDRYHDIYCLYLQLQKDVVNSAVTVSV